MSEKSRTLRFVVQQTVRAASASEAHDRTPDLRSEGPDGLILVRKNAMGACDDADDIFFDVRMTYEARVGPL